jgi:hypothetical protein
MRQRESAKTYGTRESQDKEKAMQKTLMRNKLISVLLLASFMSMSCTSYKAMQVPVLESDLKEGDTVRVIITDGRDVKFKITNITSDAIEGENQRILFKEITTLGAHPLILCVSNGSNLAVRNSRKVQT